jgi:hypothetical protein
MATNNAANIPTAAAGKVLQGAGVGVASTFSTPTYSSASGTSRKILVSDGTNNVYSTETWATPGSSGNVLTSDATNWTSAAPSGSGSSYSLEMLSGNQTTITDSTTYYLPWGTAWVTTLSTLNKLWIPKAGTITSCYGSAFVAATGSGENVTIAIRLNDTTNTNITTTSVWTTNDVAFSNNALSIAVAAGDFISIMVITPAFSSNPTLVGIGCTVFIS